jgi:acetylornithine deacetylase/succinyl-diaminopimelate desuccinylase-like protein
MKPFQTSCALLAITLAAAFTSQAKNSAPDAAHVKQTTDLLGKIVGFKTVKGAGQVPVMAEYLSQQLIQGGFAPEDVKITEVAGTATLVARYRGNGSKKPMLISNHMDVVEAIPSDWTRDPFTMVTENGYHFGRGVYDNKLDVALTVSTLLRLKKEGFKPSRDIILALSGDEETDMLSTQALSTQFPDAEFLLNGDGGGGTLASDRKAVVYGLQTAEKTFATFAISVSNPGGHSSRPRKDNAIYELANALQRLSAYQFPAQSSEQTRSSFRFTGKQIGGGLGQAMQRFADNPNDLDAVATIAADPEYVGTLSTTCVATMLSGGHAENALPQLATATVNCRIFPGVSVETVRAKLAEVIANPNVQVKEVGKAFASDASPLRDDVMQAVRKAVDANFKGLPVIPSMSSGATDSLYFRAQGIPSYGVSGAYVMPEDDYSHGLNERVPVSSVARGLTHWHVLLTELAK